MSAIAPTTVNAPIALSLAMAGGFTAYANRSHLEIHRSDGRKESYSWKSIVNGLTNNPELKPADKIVVPKRVL